jgi:hypothetical protein
MQEPMPLNERHEALKLAFESRNAELRAESEIAYKLMAGFVTLEVGLATWLAEHPPGTRAGRWGIFLLNGLLGGVLWVFICRNYGRRREIMTTIRNVAEVWGLTKPGVYLEGRAIYADPYPYSWRFPYLAVIILFCLGQGIPIFPWMWDRLVQWLWNGLLGFSG